MSAHSHDGPRGDVMQGDMPRGELARRARAGAIAAALLPFLASCVSLRWRHAAADRAPRDSCVAALAPGVSDLGACLAELGAPSEVWELPDGGFAAAWAWTNGASLGISISVPLAEHSSASFDYDQGRRSREAYVGFFDDAFVLRALRRGRLGELRAQRSPALVDASATATAAESQNAR